MVAIQDAPVRLEPGERVALGFFGWLETDHPAATSADDLACVERALALARGQPPSTVDRKSRARRDGGGTASRVAVQRGAVAGFARARRFRVARAVRLDVAPRRARRARAPVVVLSRRRSPRRAARQRAAVKRPHGHLLRTGRHAVPDESALTSTTWMAGVFHSMLTQGHVSINRMLSTVHSYLGLFRSHGQRVFVEIDGAWKLLDMPSAFEMAPDACRWIYSHAGGVIEVRSSAHSDPHELSLAVDVRSGEPLRCLVSHHIALNGDDGSAPGAARWWREGDVARDRARRAQRARQALCAGQLPHRCRTGHGARERRRRRAAVPRRPLARAAVCVSRDARRRDRSACVCGVISSTTRRAGPDVPGARCAEAQRTRRCA